MLCALLACVVVPAFAWAQEAVSPTETPAEEGATDAAPTSDTTPPVPSITIGGRDVMTVVEALKAQGLLELPASLKDGMSRHYLNHRMNVVPYNHAPQKGKLNAPVTVIEFSDLGCAECMSALSDVDVVLDQVRKEVNLLHVYAPSSAEAVQLASFYGKIAQKNDLYWEYREKAERVTTAEANTYFNILVNMGLDHTEVRRAAIRDSRRFYRELDADTALVAKRKVRPTPLWLVNGIRVGEEKAIPIAKMRDLIQYEAKRVELERKRHEDQRRKARQKLKDRQ